MNRKTLSIVLVGVFLTAVTMGSGPGIRLINPDPADPLAVFTIWGLPKIYVWGLWWYVVQLGAILIAYFKLWKDDA
jgi:hypothetical protein